MSATEDVVNQALEGLDDNLNPIEKTEDETVDNDKDVKETEDTSDTTDKENTEDDEEGYVIDDGSEEDTEEPTIEEPVKQTSNFTPEQQYIYDNLSPLSVTGKDGKVYNVKVPGELPNDFEFANIKEMMNFTAAITRQENEASRLQNAFNNERNAKTTQEFAAKENQAIIDDIATLQKSGDLPKFKKQPTDKDFDSDPAAKQVDEIIDFMNKKNEEYLKQSNNGKAFRHIGFEDAFYQYKREHPEKTRSAEQQAEDKQRKEIGRSVGSRGANADDAKKTYAQSGTTTRDLMAMIDNL